MIACDNSGAIGMKEHDSVAVPYETVAYYSFRVAVMECIAAGGDPISVVLHNFCGNKPWAELVSGIQTGLVELGLKEVPITGSTESNFSLLQSAVGLLVIGKRSNDILANIEFSEQLRFAVIGVPLVGNEVMEQIDKVVPLSIFQKICRLEKLIAWPVGSKGILYEMNQMFPNQRFTQEVVKTNVDILKSSGPATCFIAAFHSHLADKLKLLAGDYFHPVQIIKK